MNPTTHGVAEDGIVLNVPPMVTRHGPLGFALNVSLYKKKTQTHTLKIYRKLSEISSNSELITLHFP